MFAFAATMTLVLWELPLFVVRLLLLLLRGRRELEAAGSCLDLGDVDSFSACFQPCMSPFDRHPLVSDVVDGRCMLHARGCGSGHGKSPGVEHVSSCTGYMLIQGERMRTGIHVLNVVMKFLEKQRLRVRVL